MILSFVVTSVDYPVGGAIAIYEFANAMSRRGHDVHLLHRPFPGCPVPDPSEMPWVRFADGIVHRVSDPFRLEDLPPADFVFHYDPSLAPSHGLPLMFVQGTMTGRAAQELRMKSPCPKVCVARWLVDLGIEKGIPAEQLLHVPCGVDAAKYRVITPIRSRPQQVSMLHHDHPAKGTASGLEALARVRRAVPEVQVVLFGTSAPATPLPPWVRFRLSPPQEEIVGSIYNGSRVFVSPSIEEGFGLPAVEAMASGCALVTTANGGSADYAHHDETALVSGPSDPATMAAHIVALLQDDDRRVRLAQRGQALASSLTWDASAARLEASLLAYGHDPVRFGRPPTSDAGGG